MARLASRKRPILLGSLIEKLERFKPEAYVYFDFCRLTPVGVESYRSFYNHVAIGWCNTDPNTVGALLASMREAVGKKVTGYKGGEHEIGMDTPVWAANWGDASGTAIVDVVERAGDAVLITGVAR